MKICYLYDQLLPSRDTDTEQVLNTVSALGRRGVHVELVIPTLPSKPAPSADELRSYYQVQGPFEVAHEPAITGVVRPAQKLFHGLRASRRQLVADVVYTRNLHAVAFGLSRGYRVVYEHFRPWADQYPPLEPALRAMFRHPNALGLVLHSRHIVPSYARLGVTPDRMLVAHNGYEPSRMEPHLEPSAARRLLELPLDQPMLVYAGRIHERKGLLTVLELARRLSHVHFVLVGSEGEGRVELEARALQNVTVRPWQRFDATVRYLYAADVLLIPPSLEPLQNHGTTVLPMKLFQYLASGRPIFAPRAPDTAELLVDGQNAVLVDAGDLDEQARALSELMSDAERRRQLAAAAQQMAATLTWDARAEKLERFLGERLRVWETGQRGERLQEGEGSPSSAPGEWSAAGWLARTARWLGERAVRT